MTSWSQQEVRLPEFSRGIHLITNLIRESLPELSACRMGLLHVFIKHTSASLTINENASPDVRTDMDRFFDAMVPDDYDDFDHVDEGADDMPAHIKASLLGSSLTIPVTRGRMALGTWQGVYLCEHRNRGGRRTLVLTLSGDWD